MSHSTTVCFKNGKISLFCPFDIGPRWSTYVFDQISVYKFLSTFVTASIIYELCLLFATQYAMWHVPFIKLFYAQQNAFPPFSHRIKCSFILLCLFHAPQNIKSVPDEAGLQDSCPLPKTVRRGVLCSSRGTRVDTDGGYNGSLHLVGRSRHVNPFVVIVAVSSLSLYCTVALESVVKVFIQFQIHTHVVINCQTEWQNSYSYQIIKYTKSKDWKDKYFQDMIDMTPSVLP